MGECLNCKYDHACEEHDPPTLVDAFREIHGPGLEEKRQCRFCMLRFHGELVLSIGRKGGGSYRRGGRWYDSALCVTCAALLGEDPPRFAGHTSQGFDIGRIRRLLRAWCIRYEIEQPEWLELGSKEYGHGK